MSARRTLLRGGTVVTMDDRLGDLELGDVLIEGSRIEAVGQNLDVTDAETIDVSDCIVLPGLVDAHTHMWQGALRGLAHEHTSGGEYFSIVHPRAGLFSAEDMYAATYTVALELLSLGATSAFDFCHAVNSPEHADASVAALKAAGIRGVFGYSFRDRPEYASRAFNDLGDRIEDARRLRSTLPKDGLVTFAIALNSIEEVDEETNRREIQAARELDVIASVHSNFPDQVHVLRQRDLLGPDIQLVHGLTMTHDELVLLADAGARLTITPEAENLGGLDSQTGHALGCGVRVGIGCDIPAGLNANVLQQARVALQIERGRVNRRERRHGRPAKAQGDSAVTPRSMLHTVTAGGADAIGLGDRVGRLVPGMAADVLVIDSRPFGLSQGDPASHVVLQSHAGQIRFVMVDGQFRVRAGELVGVDRQRLRSNLAAAREHVGGSAGRHEGGPVEPPETSSTSRSA